MNQNINISIVGKPNVGKSTIFNKIVGSNVSKVEDISGTTIYPIKHSKIFKDLSINLIDLGGLKKKSKSHESTQKIITKETLKEINQSQIIFFVLDGSDDITKNDKQLFRLIINKLKNIIILVNKIDLVKSNLKKKELYFKFFFDKNYPNILLKPIFISAIKNIKRDFLLRKIYEIYYNSSKLIENKETNNALKKILEKKQPVYSKNRRPSIKFLKHVNTCPMIFKAFGNKLTFLRKDFKNYFSKKLMQELNIHNQTVVIKYLNNKNPYS